MTLSIIIVNYNVKYFVEQCLVSVREAIKNITAEVIVIDNFSTDGSVAYLRPIFPSFIFIENTANEGFAKANNKALAMARGKYILFLNPDTIVGENCFGACLSFFVKNASAGAIGVRMLDGAGQFLPESKRSFPSPLVAFYKMVGLSYLMPKSKLFNRYALGFLPQKKESEVDVIAGAFMMVPNAVLQTTGGFDEQFFMYAEDIDLSYRIQKAGFRNYYLGGISIVHFKGESTKKDSLTYVRIFYSAMILFVKKHYRGSAAWLLRQALHVGIAARGSLSAIAVLIKKRKTAFQPPITQISVVGSAGNTQKITAVLGQSYPHATITFEDAASVRLSANEAQVVVFCMEEISYESAIQIIEENKGIQYKWFGKNSRSIVGSGGKNSTGDVIILAD